MSRRRTRNQQLAEEQFKAQAADEHVASVIPDEEIDTEVEAAEERAQEDAEGYEALDELDHPEPIDQPAIEPVLRNGQRAAEGAVHHLDLGAAGVLGHHGHGELADLSIAQETKARQIGANGRIGVAHGEKVRVPMKHQFVS